MYPCPHIGGEYEWLLILPRASAPEKTVRPVMAEGCLWGLTPQSRHWPIALILSPTAVVKQPE